VHPIKLRYVLLLIIWLPVASFAQLKKYGPARTTPAKTFVNQNARQAADPLSLPFWDDFSFASGHPADSLWMLNHSVFVNDGQAINPPSINVATFDGYDENGLPYSTVPEENGYRDTLESQFIKLADVPGMYRNSIYLSFFYQAGGNSEIPDPDDFLKLEFKSVDGWEEIYRFKVKSNADPAVFYDTAIQIPQEIPGSIPDYFHNEFQFRFTSFGKISGAYDGWHLDYVYLNRRVNDNEEVIDPDLDINEFDKNTNISDRTITAPFSSVLSNGYFAMPYTHFLKDVTNSLEIPVLELFNLIDADFPQTSSYNAYFTVTNYSDGTPTVVLDSEELTGPLAPLPSREYASREIPSRPGDANFSVPADSSEIHVKVGINSGDNDNTRDYFSRYIPIDFRINDTVSRTFTLSNYYAYDDGVAEYAMTLAAQGNQFAYRFVMDSEVGQDTLNGAYIYFPFAAGTVPETVQIFIFRDKGGKPDSAWVYRQTIPVTRTANNLFTEINFTEGVIVRDTFYIGYLETQTGEPDRIRIGLDASHDTGEQMYYRNTVYHQWLQNDELKGSLMIRPRFGEATVITGIEDEPNPVSIYPNPNQGEFYLKGPVDNLQVITLTGQPVSHRVEQVQDTKKVMLQGAVPGLYIVRYRSGSNVYTGKILVRE
jgi:hypothetical protein